MHACSTCACLSINSGAFSGSMPVILDNLPQEAWNNIFNILHLFVHNFTGKSFIQCRYSVQSFAVWNGDIPLCHVACVHW